MFSSKILVLACVVVAESASAAPLDLNLLHRQLGTFIHDLDSSTLAHKTKPQQERGLDTAQCLAELTVFNAANPGILVALEDYDDEYDAALEECSDAEQGTSFECVIDEDTFPSTPLYMEACQQAGGEIWEYDYIVQCTATVNGETQTVSNVFLNQDNCFPKDSEACDRQEIQSEIETTVNEQLNLLEAIVEAFSEDSLSCDFGIAVTDPEGVTTKSGNLQVSSAAETPNKNFSWVATFLAVGAFMTIWDWNNKKDW